MGAWRSSGPSSKGFGVLTNHGLAINKVALSPMSRNHMIPV